MGEREKSPKKKKKKKPAFLLDSLILMSPDLDDTVRAFGRMIGEC